MNPVFSKQVHESPKNMQKIVHCLINSHLSRKQSCKILYKKSAA